MPTLSDPDPYITNPAPGVIQVRRLGGGRSRRIATREEVLRFAFVTGWTDFRGRPISSCAAAGTARLNRDLVNAFHRANRDAIYPF